jgi:hypothetical protein
MPQARLLVLAPLVMLLAACGGGGNGGTETVRVEGTEYAYVTPASIEGGVVAMEFANTGKELHEFAMVALPPARRSRTSVASWRTEARKARRAASTSEECPCSVPARR